MTMTAEQAVKAIKAVKTTFLGQEVEAHATPIEVRRELQGMAENNEISPAEYHRALKLTWPGMKASAGWMAAEAEECGAV